MSNLTKKALENSLKKMLLKKKVNKITVEDLTNDCGINRMTFYYHFHDIYELIEWVCLEDAKEAIKGKKTYDTWQEGYYQIFEAVLENKPFIMNVYKNISREHIEKFVKDISSLLKLGVVDIVGGCCGTDFNHIERLKMELEKVKKKYLLPM